VSHVDLTLIGKPGCHLCDDARDVIRSVVAALPEGAPQVSLSERSILDDPRLLDRYADEIPVILIDGRMHTYWRVDPARLRSALLEAS
jgi:hypothetical protein